VLTGACRARTPDLSWHEVLLVTALPGLVHHLVGGHGPLVGDVRCGMLGA
jgi:hypothetical protein